LLILLLPLMGFLYGRRIATFQRVKTNMLCG
jgi:hypothetical protein